MTVFGEKQGFFRGRGFSGMSPSHLLQRVSIRVVSNPS
jgi:hypothetical protein